MEDESMYDIFELYYQQIRDFPVLSAEEQKNLAKKAQKGDRSAKKELIQANLKLVVNIAKKTYKGNLDLLDAIQEGNLGLLRAIEKFDPEHPKKCKFSTFAFWGIRQKIMLAAKGKGNTIRISVCAIDTLMLYERLCNKLFAELGRKPSSEEIIEEADKRMKKSSLTLQKIKEIEKNVLPKLTLKSLDENDSNHSISLLQDSKPSIEEDLHEKMKKENIIKVLEVLDPKERDIIFKRFGLEDDVPKTLKEIGIMYNTTGENIRQIENKALRKLRHPANTQRLIRLIK